MVQPGDTLSSIAAWLHLHGYDDLYAANRTVLGANPSVIRPGQQLLIGPSGVVTAPDAGRRAAAGD